MPDETKATFTDQLEITVDTAKFQASLNEAQNIYRKFVADLGADADKVLSVGIGAGLSQQISELITGIGQLSDDNLKTWQEMALSITAIMEVLGASEAKAAAASVALAKETADKKIAEAKRVAEETASKTGLAPDGKPWPSGTDVANPNGAQREALKIADEQLGLEYEIGLAHEKAEQANVKFNKDKLDSLQKQGTIQARAEQDNERYDARRLAALEKEKAEYAALNAEAKASADARNAAGPRDTDYGKVFAPLFREQEESWARTDKLIQQAQARADAYYEDIKRQNAEAKANNQAANAVPPPPTDYAKVFAPIFEAQEATWAKTDKLIAQAETRADSYYAKLDKGGIGGLVEQLGLIAKIQIEWTIISELLQGMTALVTAPFKALAEGVEYQKQAEKSADELMGILSANVKYSADIASNFKEIQANSGAVVQKLQDIAILSNTPFDTVIRVFKSLMDGGISKYTTDMRQVLDVTTMFVTSLNAAGAKGLALNSQIANMGTLFDGTVTSSNKLLKILELTPLEWQKSLDRAKEHGTLVAELGPKLKPYTDALVDSGQHLAHMQELLDKIKERIEAQGAAPIYEALERGTKAITEWVDEHSPQLIAVFKVLSNLVVEFGGVLVTIFTNPAFLYVIKSLGIEILAVLNVAVGMIDTTLTGFKVLNAGLRGQFGEAKEIFDEYKTRMEGIAKGWKDLGAAAFGGGEKKEDTGSGGPLDNKFNPLGDDPKAKLDLEPLIAELQKARNTYKDTAESIKESSDQQRKAVDLDLASQVISHKEAAEKIKVIVDGEIGARRTAWAAYVAEYNRVLSQVANAPVRTTQEQDKRTKEVDSLKNTFSAESRSESKADNSDKDVITAAQRAADIEEVRIAKDHYASMSKLREEDAKYELSVIKEQTQAGYLTKAEAFDKETALSQLEHERKLNDLNAELNDYGRFTQGWLKLNQSIELAAAQYADQTALRAQQRKEVIEQERQSQIASADQARAIALEAAQSQEAIAASVRGPDTGAETALYLLKQKNLELLIREKEAQLQLAEAKNKESQESRNLSNQLDSLYNQRLKNAQERIKEVERQVPDEHLRSTVTRPILRDAVSLAEDDANQAAHKLQQFQDKNGVNQYDPEIQAQEQALIDTVDQTQEALAKVQGALERSAPNIDRSLEQFASKLLGFDPVVAFKEAKANDGDHSGGSENGGVTGYDGEIAVGASAVANGFKAVVNAAATYEQGVKEGGALGGVGALVSKFGAMIPGIGGAIAGAVGSIMSTVGALFTAAAARIAADIQDREKKTMAAFQNGTLSLANTLAAVQQEEADAIRQLSGKKGGQDQLDKILPGLQSQIASLQKQVDDTRSSFEATLDNLRLQSDTLSSINQQWQQINKQVSDYLNAGGSAAAAQEFLSLQLRAMQKTAQEQLDQGEGQAIQDAIQLNGLLQQKLNLTQQYNQQVFDVVNKDSIERRAGAVQSGQQLAQITAQYSAQLEQLNSQIDLTTQKVTLEKTVFDIATNIADLHNRDNALQIAALDLQILKYKDLQTIIAGITQSGGQFSAAPGLFNSLPTTINVALNLAGYTLTATGTITGNGSGATLNVNPDNNAQMDRFSQELARQSRMKPR